MAQSPSHKFGQIIGDMLEQAIEPILRAFAQQYGLYLDKHGYRPARAGKNCTWTDAFGNCHDLDYVLERGGTDQIIGVPVAFVESAWRRYTKHSRNKAQEIQAAILPISAAHQNVAPFVAVVLAGEFTQGALGQLRSQGFYVLYFPYEEIIKAFAHVGLDAYFDEKTPDSVFAEKVQAWRALAPRERAEVSLRLVQANMTMIEQFVTALTRAVTWYVERVRVLPMHGVASDYPTIEAAIMFIEQYHDTGGAKPLMRYEIEVCYSNGDRIEGRFAEGQDAIRFLRSYLSFPYRAV